MRTPLIMHEGGTQHLEHMVSRLDSIEDELLSFERHLDGLSHWDHCWTGAERDAVTCFLSDAQSAVEQARSHLKRLRKRIKPRRP